MPITQSSMFPLGAIAPDFSLLDVNSGKVLSLQELKGSKGTVIMFICNHCPFVAHVRKEIGNLAFDYTGRGIEFIAINPNDVVAFPMDAPDKMKQLMADFSHPFSFLFDETQQVAKAYHAACTPDFYLFDWDLKCVYRGRMDDSLPSKNIPVTGCELREAMENLLEGKPIAAIQHPSMGCSIKWK